MRRCRIAARARTADVESIAGGGGGRRAQRNLAESECLRERSRRLEVLARRRIRSEGRRRAGCAHLEVGDDVGGVDVVGGVGVLGLVVVVIVVDVDEEGVVRTSCCDQSLAIFSSQRISRQSQMDTLPLVVIGESRGAEASLGG